MKERQVGCVVAVRRRTRKCGKTNNVPPKRSSLSCTKLGQNDCESLYWKTCEKYRKWACIKSLDKWKK
jgi:hypothetical protein